MQIHLPPAWAIKVLNGGRGEQVCGTLLHFLGRFTIWICALCLSVIIQIAGVVL